MKALILRLDAPMVSFGAALIDQHGYIERFPGTSLFTGLIANALGWSHGDFERLEDLQQRIELAARWDVPPQPLMDYQTVDLGQAKMCRPGWTTRGNPEHRAGGTASKGTHQRYRHYWVDGLMTVALALTGSADPQLDTVRKALERPARPLFLGRKHCLPARPLMDPRNPVVEAENLLEALDQVEPWDRQGQPAARRPLEACWPARLASNHPAAIRTVYELRDWANQLPTGAKSRAEGLLGEVSL